MAESRKILTKRQRILITGCTLLVFLNQGLSHGIISVTLIDLKERFRTNYESLHTAMMVRAVGQLLGAYAGGAINDYMPHRVFGFLCICLVITGCTGILIPWSPHLVVYGILEFLQGFWQSASVVSSMTLLLRLWEHMSAVSLHVAQALRPAATFAAAVIARPFLSPAAREEKMCLEENRESSFDYCTVRNTTNKVKETTTEYNQIHWPFLIVGLVGMISGVVFLLASIYLPSPLEKVQKHTKSLFASLKTKRSKTFYAYVILLFIGCVAGSGTETSLHMGLMPVAVESALQLSKDSGAIIGALHSLTRSIGRIVWAVSLYFISIKLIAPICTTIETIFGGILATLGVTSRTLFWIVIPLHSFFGSAAFPSFVPLADRYIYVTGIIVGMTETGSAVGSFAAIYFNGLLLDHVGARWVLILSFVWSCIMVFIIYTMLAIGKCVPDRFNEDGKNSDDYKEDTQSLMDQTEAD